jgi:hypothetical protein
MKFDSLLCVFPILAATAITVHGQTQRDFASVQIKATHVAGNVHMLEGKIIPGHGPLATRTDLVAFRDMMLETINLVKKAQAEGKTLVDVKAAGLPEKYKDWGAGFINASRWLEISFNSLAKK